MSFAKIFGALALGTLLVGCGSPLTDSQKAAFKDMQKDVNSVIGKGSGRTATWFGALATANNRNVELETKLAEKLKNCTVKQPAAGDKNVVVKVDGDNCGLTMDMQMNTSLVDDKGVDATFKIFFEIKDADLLALSDVSKMDLSGHFKVSAALIDIKLTGYIDSKKNGKVTMNITGSGNAQSGGSFAISYKAKTFDVNVEMKQSSDGKVAMSINGKSASAQEVNDLLGSLIPGTDTNAPEGESATGSMVELK